MTSSIASNTPSTLSINPTIQKATSSSTAKHPNSKTAILSSVSRVFAEIQNLKNLNLPNTTTRRLGPGRHFFSNASTNLPAEQSKEESVGSKPDGSFLAPAVTPNLGRKNSEVLGPINTTTSNENNS